MTEYRCKKKEGDWGEKEKDCIAFPLFLHLDLHVIFFRVRLNFSLKGIKLTQDIIVGRFSSVL